MSERILILVALSLILVMVAGTSYQMHKPQTVSALHYEQITKARINVTLPDVATVDAAGDSKSLASRITRPTAINFWATWCIPCLRELPTMGRFKEMANAAGVDVITISEDKEGAAQSLKLLAEKGVPNLPLLVDADGSVAKVMRVRGLPTTVIVNAKGEEVGRMEGEADWGDKTSLDSVLKLLEADPLDR